MVSVELSPDGAQLVSAGTDGSARVWQLADGAELARLEHPIALLDTCFSPDSRLIATVCSDDIVRLWTWRADDLSAEGQSRIPRRLSNAELDSLCPTSKRERNSPAYSSTIGSDPTDDKVTNCRMRAGSGGIRSTWWLIFRHGWTSTPGCGKRVLNQLAVGWIEGQLLYLFSGRLHFRRGVGFFL